MLRIVIGFFGRKGDLKKVIIKDSFKDYLLKIIALYEKKYLWLYFGLTLVIVALGFLVYLGFRRGKNKKLLQLGLLFISLLLGFLLSAFLAETNFYRKYGAIYFFKSKIKDSQLLPMQTEVFKDDLELVDFDTSNDFVVLSENVFSESKITRSANANFKLLSGGNLVLSSTDSKPAFLELRLKKELDYPGNLMQVVFSVLIKNGTSGTGYLSTFEFNGDKDEQIFYNDSTNRNNWYLLSGFFHRFSHPNGFVYPLNNYIFRMRIYTRGKNVIFTKPKLTAVRVYSGVEFDYKTVLPVKGYQEKLDRSANKVFMEPVNRKKDNSKIRILCLGGSTTWGYGTGGATTYPTLLKSLLNSYLESQSGRQYEVINAGIMGDTTFGLLYQLDRTDLFPVFDPQNNFPYLKSPIFYTKYSFLDLKPDVVFLAPMFNDLYYGFVFNRYQAFGGNKKISKIEKINSFLRFEGDNYLKSLFWVKYNAIGYYFYKFYHQLVSLVLDEKLLIGQTPPDYREKLISDYKMRLSLLVKKLKDNKIGVVLLQFPYMPTDEQKEIYQDISKEDNQVLKEVANEFKVPFVDLMKNNNNQYQDKKYWHDYVHPTGYGYLDYATKIFNRLFPITNPEISSEWF